MTRTLRSWPRIGAKARPELQTDDRQVRQEDSSQQQVNKPIQWRGLSLHGGQCVSRERRTIPVLGRNGFPERAVPRPARGQFPKADNSNHCAKTGNKILPVSQDRAVRSPANHLFQLETEIRVAVASMLAFCFV